MRIISFLMLMATSICYSQSFDIIGDERICTSPHSYNYSVSTSEIGYTYSWFLVGQKIGEGNTVTVKVANVSSFDLILEAELGGTIIRTKKMLLSSQTPEILPIESFSLCPGEERVINSKEKYNDPVTKSLWYKDESLVINNQSLTITEGGDYSIVYSTEGCNSDSLNLHVEQINVSDFESLFDIEYGERVDLQIPSEVLTTYEVSLKPFGGDRIEGTQGQFFIDRSGEYEVDFISKELSCEFTHEKSVAIRVNKPLTIPNAFTPNGDRENDVWLVNGLSLHEKPILTIYSRWGVVVYQILAADSDVVWDGKYEGEYVPVGTYYYTIVLSDDKSNVIKGDVSVLY